jgi:hypothetical protein
MANPETFLVKIPPGVMLRDPESGRVAVTGEEYPRTGFWGRRLAAGEVEELAAEPERAALPAAGPQP